MTITKTVTTPKEYDDAIDAADTLGLDVSETYFSGVWETDDGVLSWPKKSEITGIGYKYFNVMMDGSKEKIVVDDGCLEITFTEK